MGPFFGGKSLAIQCTLNVNWAYHHFTSVTCEITIGHERVAASR